MKDNEGLTGLARLSGLLVHEHDPVGVITAGLLEACRCVSADAGGVLVRSTNEHLDVLAATSHRAADLEAYQATAEEGPCVESMRTRQVVLVDDPTAADERWPGFGDRMRSAGYERCFAVPMRWQGVGIGGLNLFWKTPGSEAVDGLLLQTFADVLTLAVLHVRPLSTDAATERLQDALEARGGVEQAKGVLAWQRDLDMGDAYAALLRIAEERDLTLGEAADAVVDGAMRGETL
jgi:GAF domain-containing protein